LEVLQTLQPSLQRKQSSGKAPPQLSKMIDVEEMATDLPQVRKQLLYGKGGEAHLFLWGQLVNR
jgi:hypothetical protein